MKRGFLTAIAIIAVTLCAAPLSVWAQAATPAAAATTTPAATPAPAATTTTDATRAANEAKDDPAQDEQMGVSLLDAFALNNKLRTPDVNPQDMGSLFFTKWQYALLQEAKRGFLSRPPSASELRAAANADPNAPQRQKGIRELSVGGIAYHNDKDWTVWLNGKRVTPDALPDGVLDLKVSDDHIDLKWFDSYTNLIYPVRMRPHQRFNLDARIFLPGAGIEKQ